MRVLFALLMPAILAAQVDVLTQHNGRRRSGLNVHETVLNHQSVKAGFGKLWTLYSDAKIMAQPLYVSNLKSGKCPDGCNTVIFASMKGTVYAYQADQPSSTQNDTLVWARYLGDPRDGGGDFDMWATDDPWWGILGTPVIDRATNSFYTVVWNKDQQYRLYNLDLTSGNIKQGPVVVQGSVAGVNFNPGTPGFAQLRKQRAGLLLLNGSLYVAFGGDNRQALAGWLFVYDTANLSLKTIWSPTPGGRNGGIWQAGQGLAGEGDGSVYVQTGDGDVDPATSRFGDSIVKLQLEQSGNGFQMAVRDFFTPCNQEFLQMCDLDQGSAGPLLFGDNFLIGGGKAGMVYLMTTKKLGGYKTGPHPPPDHACEAVPGVDTPDCEDSADVLQKFRATTGHIHGSPVFWWGPGGKGWLYVMGEGDNLKAYPFNGSRFDVNNVLLSGWKPPKPGAPPCGGPVDNWMPGGTISVSSNGSKPGTGIVWVLTPSNGDANSFRGVKGMLMAFNAEDIRQELWRSQANDAALSDTPNSLGLLARFAAPTTANGKVFVPTAGDSEPLDRYCGRRPGWDILGKINYRLVVYGLKQ